MGGGNACDFVAAMTERQLHDKIDRKEAETILKEIREGKRLNHPAPMHGSIEYISTETTVTP